MRIGRIIGVFVALIIILNLLSCSNNTTGNDISIPENDISATQPQSTGQIYLYGEAHGVEKIKDKEFDLWYEYYHNQDMRHLFIETAYYTAEFLNLWMQSESNEILDELYSDWAGTSGQNPYAKEFFEKIKSQCPETIFHGTDVGHQYQKTGQRYLSYLIKKDLEDTEEYRLAIENINQGKYYYKHRDKEHEYRENMMVENFIREFDKLSGESIMGIYGASHTGLDSMDYYNIVPCMANQLKERYGDNIYSEDLSILAKDIEPHRVDIIKLGGKDYEALYFGKQNITWHKDYSYREYWRLENAYDDFVDKPTWGVLPYDQFPMLIETGQVFVIDLTKTDGSVMRMYYRSDGYVWNNKPSTEGFTLEDLPKLIDPERVDAINIAGKDYEASYYGKVDFEGLFSVEYWHLENAYDDFKDYPKNGNVLHYDNYPFSIETGQVFVVEFTMTDGSVMRRFFRSDGNEKANMPSTEEFAVE